MNDEETIALLKRGYDDWNRRDLDGMLELFHEDALLQTSGLFLGIEPLYHGHAGWRAFWSDFTDAYEEFNIEPREFIRRGGVWLVPVHFRGRGRGSEGMVELPSCHAFVIREGLAIWIGVYESEAEALEAARGATE